MLVEELDELERGAVEVVADALLDGAAGPKPATTPSTANLRNHDAGDASVRDEYVLEVDYQLCHRCRIGWVEQPHTLDPYRRRGLAAAGLAALRTENPGFTWHTLGGHIDGSPAFPVKCFCSRLLPV